MGPYTPRSLRTWRTRLSFLQIAEDLGMWLTRQLPLQLAYSDGAKRPVRQVRFHCTWLGTEWRRERPPPVSDGSLTPPERASPPSGASSVSSTSTQPADSLRTLRSTTAPGPVAPMRKRSGPPGSAACAARRPVLARLEPAASGPSRRPRKTTTQ